MRSFFAERDLDGVLVKPLGEEAGGESREDDQSCLHLGVSGATVAPLAQYWSVL